MNTSFTKFKRSTVIDLCRSTIERIKTNRAEKDKAWIQANRRKVGFFFGRLQTDEEVIAGAGFLEYPCLTGYGALDTAEKLLNLAIASENEYISVNAEDYDYIKPV